MAVTSIHTQIEKDANNCELGGHNVTKYILDSLTTLREKYGELGVLLSKEKIERIITDEEVFGLITDHSNKSLFGNERAVIVKLFNKTFGEGLDKIKDGLVINLGSGWGIHSRMLNEEFGFKVWDIEILTNMSRQANAVNKHVDNNAIKEINAEASNLPVEKESVDIFFSHGTIRFIREQEKMQEVFTEIIRTLKKGGTAIVGDVDIPSLEITELALKHLGIKYTTEDIPIEVFRLTRFYCLYIIFKEDADFMNTSKNDLFGEANVEQFREEVNRMAQERNTSPLQILIDLAGYDKKILRYFIFEKPNT